MTWVSIYVVKEMNVLGFKISDLDWIGLDWTGLDWTGLDMICWSLSQY
jgi:hypothetical protein